MRLLEASSMIAAEPAGALLGLIWRSMPDPGPSFRQFADGLKKRVESGG